MEKLSQNSQIKAYVGSREPKYHQLELVKIIKERNPDFSGSLLDIGCASGVFIELFKKNFPKSKCVGVDISAELVEIAIKENKENSECLFYVDDALKLEKRVVAEIVTASGVMSIFDDYVEPIKTWLSCVSSGGLLVVFGCFNSKDVDTQIKFRNNFNSSDWETGLTAFSIKTVSDFLSKLNCSFEFIKFEMPVPIAEENDPIRSYTRDTTDGERLILNGANIRTELFHLVIKKA